MLNPTRRRSAFLWIDYPVRPIGEFAARFMQSRKGRQK
jgi:hypothetical protein